MTINTIQPMCQCKAEAHTPKFIVLTGGPSAGKSAVLEMIQKIFCSHITVIPESASIIFSGGFFRRPTNPAVKGAQRAIFKVQQELEQIIFEEQNTALAICDRGTLDGLAYWPESESNFWKQVGSSKKVEFSRYQAVIHLKTPPLNQGYNLNNPMRIESATQAHEIDSLLLEIWQSHPNHHIIESNNNFFLKAQEAIQTIQNYIPQCCKKNNIQLDRL